MHDVIVVGAGPAGLNAALVLARARRRVVMFDEGRPRNRWSAAAHNFLTRDGIEPGELLRLGREEVERYGVEIVSGQIMEARALKKGEIDGEAWNGKGTGFEVKHEDGSTHRARKLLLATGMRDELPAVRNVEAFYGRSVHHCPYCDAWRWRDRPIASYGRDDKAVGLALLLRGWTDRVVAVTDGPSGFSKGCREAIERVGISVIETPIERLDGEDGRLKRVVLADGTDVQVESMFFNTGERQTSALAKQLGVKFDTKGGAIVDDRERTNVRGLYLAGDASREVQFLIVAAAQGATAAVAMNHELQTEEGRVIG